MEQRDKGACERGCSDKDREKDAWIEHAGR